MMNNISMISGFKEIRGFCFEHTLSPKSIFTPNLRTYLCVIM